MPKTNKCENCGGPTYRTDHRIRYCDECKEPKKCICSRTCKVLAVGHNPKSGGINPYAKGHRPYKDRENTIKLRCKRCSKPFMSWRKDAVLCKRHECARGPKKRKCQNCGDSFIHNSPRVRFCAECKKPKRCSCSKSCIAMTLGTYKGQDKIALYALNHTPKSVRKRISVSVSKHWSGLGKKQRNELVANMSAGRRFTGPKQSLPEKMLHDALDKRIFKYTGTQNLYQAPISADLTAPSVKLIIQVDGCYWHECPRHGSGKFPDKRSKDRKLTQHAEKQGWVVLRFWEHEVKNSLQTVVDKINEKCKRLRTN